MARSKIVSQEKLETALQDYRPNGLTNLTPSQLYHSAVDYVPIDQHGTLNQIYFFFDRDDRSIVVPIAGKPQLAIAFDPDRYGFLESHAQIKISPRRIDLPLTPDVKKKYERILYSKAMGPNPLFDSVGSIVNDPMEYDFEKARVLRIENQEVLGMKKEEMEKDMKEFEDRVKRTKEIYRPTGKEVVRGICKDAGNRIRELLLSLRMEETYGYTYARSDNSETKHDTTVVFSKRGGRWAVINSKSPVKPYNLVPKENLPELGRPFISSF